MKKSYLKNVISFFMDVVVLAFLMLLIGYIYISNHLTYLNPMLQFWGYRNCV